MRTALVMVLVVVAVGASAFGLQAAGLRQAPPANRMAARAAGWLLGYRYVTSTVDVHGKTVAGRCFHGWFAGGRGPHDDRGTLLLLSSGGSIRALGSRIVSTRSFLPAAIGALELAGCTDVLGPRLAALAEFDGGIRVTPARLDGRRVLALHVRRLVVLVAPGTDRPVGVRLGGIESRFSLRSLRPALSRRLEAA